MFAMTLINTNYYGQGENHDIIFPIKSTSSYSVTHKYNDIKLAKRARFYAKLHHLSWRFSDYLFFDDVARWYVLSSTKRDKE